MYKVGDCIAQTIKSHELLKENSKNPESVKGFLIFVNKILLIGLKECIETKGYFYIGSYNLHIFDELFVF